MPGETLTCLSLNATVALAMRVLHSDLSVVTRSLLVGMTLSGHAHLDSGVLRLSNGADVPRGRVQLETGRPLHSFELRFALSMAEGGYVELVYADLPHESQAFPCTPRCADDPSCLPHAPCAPLEQLPQLPGLRLRLDATRPPHAVEVRLHGRTIWRRSIASAAHGNEGGGSDSITDGSASTGSESTSTDASNADADAADANAPLLATSDPVPVVISVRRRQLRIVHGSALLLAGLELPDWDAEGPTPSWRMSLGASAAARLVEEPQPLVGGATIDDIELTDASEEGRTRSHTVAFAVSINAQQFSADGTRFAYFAPPAISSILPASGSSAGGTMVTVHGANFNSTATHTLCLFALRNRPSEPLSGDQWAARSDVADATRDSDHVVRCRAPLAPFHVEPLRVNLSQLATTPPPAHTADVTAATDAAASSAASSNGTASNATSTLNGTDATPARSNGTAASGGATADVGASEDDVSSGEGSSGELGGSGEFSSGELGGSGEGSSGELGGSGEGGPGEGGPGTVAGNESTSHGANQTDAFGAAVLDVSLNGRQFTQGGPPYVFYGSPIISSISPACGPTAGGTVLRVLGYQLNHGSAYRCSFGGVDGERLVERGSRRSYDGVLERFYSAMTVEASLAAVTEAAGVVALRCVSPPWLSVGAHPVEISLNAQDFTSDGFVFATYAPPNVSAMVPRSGSAAGGTHVRVEHGAGPGCDHRCAFGNGSTSVVAGTATEEAGGTACASPPLSAVGSESGGGDGGAGGGGGAFHVLEVSLNGQQFTSTRAHWDYFDPRVLSLSPSSGPEANTTHVVVMGRHLSSRAERFVCAFGEQLVNATRHSDTAIVCATAGALPGAGAVPLEVRAQRLSSPACAACAPRSPLSRPPPFPPPVSHPPSPALTRSPPLARRPHRTPTR